MYVCMYVCMCVCVCVATQLYSVPYLLLCAGKGVMGGVAEGALSIGPTPSHVIGETVWRIEELGYVYHPHSMTSFRVVLP